MEFQNVLESRRSIRSYDPKKPVTKAMMEQLIGAAIEAPSWKNSQTARYYCVMSEEMLARVKEECLPPFNAKNVRDAKALIVAAYQKNTSGFEPDHQTPTNELGNGWGIYDLGLANENLLLKAAEFGLGTLVMGIRDAARLREILAISQEHEIVSVIAVGYPAVDAKRPGRKSVEEIAGFY